MSEPIKIVRLITEEVSTPRLDGTPGSALYRVPFELSAAPPAGVSASLTVTRSAAGCNAASTGACSASWLTSTGLSALR